MEKTFSLQYPLREGELTFHVQVESDICWLSLNQIKDVLGRDLAMIQGAFQKLVESRDINANEHLRYDVFGNLEACDLEAFNTISSHFKSKKGANFCNWVNREMRQRLQSSKPKKDLEKLELLDRKIDIRRKRSGLDLELLDKKMDIRKKKIEIQREIQELEEFESSKHLAEQQILLHKVEMLKEVLTASAIDENRTIIGGEPFMTPLLNDLDRDIVKEKLILLIQQF